jgi:arginine decarboxylase
MGQGLVVQGLGSGRVRRRRHRPREDWIIKAEDDWHGFGNLAPGFNMLDPIKATIVNPGLSLDGKFDETGIPASIVTKYLAEHGVIIENAACTLLHHVHHRHHQGPLEHPADRAAAVQGRLRQEPADVAHPAGIRGRQPDLRKMGLRDLCQQIHDFYKAYDVARLTTEMYLSDMSRP